MGAWDQATGHTERREVSELTEVTETELADKLALRWTGVGEMLREPAQHPDTEDTFDLEETLDTRRTSQVRGPSEKAGVRATEESRTERDHTDNSGGTDTGESAATATESVEDKRGTVDQQPDLGEITEDDFGPIDRERWNEVPCVDKRPQRVYELRDSDEPLSGDQMEAITESRARITEILDEAEGRELNVEDVQEAIQHINPTDAGLNCVECAKAVDDFFRRHAAVAGPTEDQSKHYVENGLSPRAIDYIEDIRPPEIELDLLDDGPGARGIVIAWQNYGPTHAYNVANIEGDVYWVDGQRQTVASNNPHRYTGFELYRTA